MADDTTCVVCLHPCERPRMLTACHHHACADCAAALLRFGQPRACPKADCGAPIDGVSPCRPAVAAALTRLSVRCAGCGTNVRAQDRAAHPAVCPNCPWATVSHRPLVAMSQRPPTAAAARGAAAPQRPAAQQNSPVTPSAPAAAAAASPRPAATPAVPVAPAAAAAASSSASRPSVLGRLVNWLVWGDAAGQSAASQPNARTYPPLQVALDGGWTPYSAQDQAAVAAHLNSQGQVVALSLTSNGTSYSLDFQRMVQRNASSGYTRPLRWGGVLVTKLDGSRTCAFPDATQTIIQQHVTQHGLGTPCRVSVTQQPAGSGVASYDLDLGAMNQRNVVSGFHRQLQWLDRVPHSAQLVNGASPAQQQHQTLEVHLTAGWTPLDPAVQTAVRALRTAGGAAQRAPYSFTARSTQYTIDLGQMTQTNTSTGHVRNLRWV